jgi:hypothetical protein
MSIASTIGKGTSNYIYVSSDKKVRLILVEGDVVKGVTIVSGDVESKSRPGQFHHARIMVSDNGWMRFSCSCEASAHGYLCHHVMELYNIYRKNRKKLMGLKKSRLERGENYGEV